MAKRRKVSNMLALSLLSLLMQRPMYPYEMAATLRERGKDESVKINWGSLYTLVQNLEKYGFIEAVEVVREGRQPERTTYQITEAGAAELQDWLRELIGQPEREYTKFEAGLSEAGILSPDEVIGLLQDRLKVLEVSNAGHRAALDGLGAQLPRLFLVESEYHLALGQAEEKWVRGILAELTDGSFPGIDAWRQFHETGELPEEYLGLAIEDQEKSKEQEGGTATGS